jgi:hypothetical protein
MTTPDELTGPGFPGHPLKFDGGCPVQLKVASALPSELGFAG